MTVFEAGSVTIPCERSHGFFGAARHLRAPTMLGVVDREAAGQGERALDRAAEVLRLHERPGRVADAPAQLEAVDRPPSVGVASETARSGTRRRPALPPTLRRPVSPSFVSTTICYSRGK